MDLKTLWDRTNDAINTIIRRDESTETGELLQPCIEGTHPDFTICNGDVCCFEIILAQISVLVIDFNMWYFECRLARQMNCL